MMRQQHCAAYTLIELMMVLAIAAVVLAAGNSGLSYLVQRSERQASIDSVYQTVRFAREIAVNHSSRVVICHVTQSGECARSWEQELTTFVDSNFNRKLDSNERILLLTDKAPEQSIREYPRTAISFDSRGFAGGYNGTLEYCIGEANPKAIAIVISRVGRIREAQDNDGDGLPETPSGRPVRCPQSESTTP